MARFFIQNKISVGETLALSREESHHLAKVLRLTEGDSVELIDGKGLVAKAIVQESSSKAALVKIESISTDDSQSLVTLAFGISKSNAIDFLIRRATEIGVKAFQPLLSQHSLHPDSWNEDRWNRLIAEVCKQCELQVFPTVLPPLKLPDWVRTRDSKHALIYCYENSRNDQLILAEKLPVDLVIGAEGGFSPQEITLLQEAGARSLGLGKNKLRVETATIVALTLLKQKLGEI